MKENIYLFRSGELKRKDNTLAYILKNETSYIPVEQIDTIHCFGETKLNKRVLQFLSSYNIGIYFYNRYGRCIGKYNANSYRAGKDILMQSEAYLNENKRNNLILSMEKASIHNCLSVTKYYLKEKYDLQAKADELQKLSDSIDDHKLSDKDFYEHILLAEARFKQVYYSIFDIVLAETPFRFNKRDCFPP